MTRHQSSSLEPKGRSRSNKSPAPARNLRKPAAARTAPHAQPETGAVAFGDQFEPTETGFVTMFEAPALTRVNWVKNGIGARDAKAILDQLRFPRGEALAALQIAAPTVNRKAKNNAHLSPAESERVLGVGRLLGQLQTIVQESGNPDGFDASVWLSTWLGTPVSALGGARPLDFMDTMTGQALVSQLIAQMQSGAYA